MYIKKHPDVPIFSYLSFTKSSKPIIFQKLSSQPLSDVYVHLHTTVQRDLEKRQYRHRVRQMNTFGFKPVTRNKLLQKDLLSTGQKLQQNAHIKKNLVTAWSARLEDLKRTLCLRFFSAETAPGLATSLHKSVK